MKINLMLETEDPNMIDEGHDTDFTNGAYDALSNAPIDAGFVIDEGSTPA